MLGSVERVPKISFIRDLTYSNEDENWQLVCTESGCVDSEPHAQYPPKIDNHRYRFKPVAIGRTLNEYQFVYVTKGRGVFESGGRSFLVHPGSIMVILPGVRHLYRPDYEVGWMEYWVGAKGPYLDTLREKGFLSSEKPFYDVGLQKNLLEIYMHIFEEVKTQAPLYQARASSYLILLIAEIISHERKGVHYSHSAQLVEKAKFLMEENIYGDINVHAISDMLGVNTVHLNEVFKSYTAMTPYQYFISIKIHRAEEVLEQGGVSIKEAAFRLGFKDQYYFSRLFKIKTGISPSRWKDFVHQ